jgi:hypothetical protein
MRKQKFANRENTHCASMCCLVAEKLANLLISKVFHSSLGSASGFQASLIGFRFWRDLANPDFPESARGNLGA